MSLGASKKITESTEDVEIAVASAATVYTKSIKIEHAEFFGLWVKATSASSDPSVKIEVEQSDTRPTTEGSSDGNWAVPENMPDVFSDLSDEVAHIATISPAPMPYLRFKITGSGTNPADTTLEMNLFIQSK